MLIYTARAGTRAIVARLLLHNDNPVTKYVFGKKTADAQRIDHKANGPYGTISIVCFVRLLNFSAWAFMCRRCVKGGCVQKDVIGQNGALSVCLLTTSSLTTRKNGLSGVFVFVNS